MTTQKRVYNNLGGVTNMKLKKMNNPNFNKQEYNGEIFKVKKIFKLNLIINNV